MGFRFCSLSSGSSGNASYIGTSDTHLLVDAGLTGKKLIASLIQIGIQTSELHGILVTHEHGDHIRGVGILSRKFKIPIYANEQTWEAMEHKIGKIDEKNRIIFNSDRDFYIRDINVQPFNIPHDTVEPVGYSFYFGNRKISIATDLGHITNKIKNSLAGSDLLLLESNHDITMLNEGSYPYPLKRRILGKNGHLSNEAAGDVLVELVNRNVRHVLLGHLSADNNIPELAYKTVVRILQENGIKEHNDIRVDMTYRDSISGNYHVR